MRIQFAEDPDAAWCDNDQCLLTFNCKKFHVREWSMKWSYCKLILVDYNFDFAFNWFISEDFLRGGNIMSFTSDYFILLIIPHQLSWEIISGIIHLYESLVILAAEKLISSICLSCPYSRSSSHSVQSKPAHVSPFTQFAHLSFYKLSANKFIISILKHIIFYFL